MLVGLAVGAETDYQMQFEKGKQLQRLNETGNATSRKGSLERRCQRSCDQTAALLEAGAARPELANSEETQAHSNNKQLGHEVCAQRVGGAAENLNHILLDQLQRRNHERRDRRCEGMPERANAQTRQM